MTTNKKLLAVFGATGLQGGSVVQHILTHPLLTSAYTLRAITRNPSSQKALALVSRGVEVVQADLDNEESLKFALHGAHAVFLVTDFWSNPDAVGYEIEQGKQALRVLASLPSLEHLVFSSLPSISLATNGKVTGVRHFDGKAELMSYLRAEFSDLWDKTTVLWIAVYFQAWKLFPLAPNRAVVKGREVWVQTSAADPESRLPTIDVRDTGIVVGAILLRGVADVGGKIVKMVENLKLSKMLEIFGTIHSEPVHFNHISEIEAAAAMQGLGLTGYRASSLADLPRAFRECDGQIYTEKGVEEGVQVLNAKGLLGKEEGLRTWEDFVMGEKWDGLWDGTGYMEMTASYEH